MTEIAVAYRPKAQDRNERKAVFARTYPARVARQLALAHALQKRVHSGEFTDYADMARALGFTRARITQMMDLLLLPPDIQEEILFLEISPGAQPISERALREKLLRSVDWIEQRCCWSELRGAWGHPLRSG